MQRAASFLDGPEYRQLRERIAYIDRTHGERGCGDPYAGCGCQCADHPCKAAEPERCGRCNGTGITGDPALRLGDPGFGRAIPCPECGEAGAVIAETRARYLLGPDASAEDLATCAIEKLDLTSAVRVDVEAWWETPEAERPPFLVICGDTGTGKTHAATGIAGRVVDSGRYAYVATVPRLLNELRSVFDSEGRTLADALKQPMSVYLLVLDDLDAEKGTEWGEEQLFTVVNERQKRGRLTVITTNVRPRKAPRTRLWSRVYGSAHSRVILTDGPDRRFLL